MKIKTVIEAVYIFSSIAWLSLLLMTFPSANQAATRMEKLDPADQILVENLVKNEGFKITIENINLHSIMGKQFVVILPGYDLEGNMIRGASGNGDILVYMKKDSNFILVGKLDGNSYELKEMRGKVGLIKRSHAGGGWEPPTAYELSGESFVESDKYEVSKQNNTDWFDVTARVSSLYDLSDEVTMKTILERALEEGKNKSGHYGYISVHIYQNDKFAVDFKGVADNNLDIIEKVITASKIDNVAKRDQENIISELRKGDVSVFRRMIDNGTNVDAREEGSMEGEKVAGPTLLMLTACGKDCNVNLTEEDQISLLKLLLSKGADVNANVPWGETVLTYAIAGEKHEGKTEEETKGGLSRLPIVKMLLDRGAKPNVGGAYEHTMWGVTCLTRAAKHGYYQVVALLLKYGAYQGIDHALEVALSNHHDQTAKVLRQAVADLDQLRQGKSIWDLTDMKINGKKVSFKSLRYNFEDGKLFTTNSIYKFRINPIMTPMHLDVIGENKTIFGIYEVKNDQLKIAYQLPSSSEGRPKDFTTVANSKSIVMIFRKLTPDIYFPLNEGQTWTYLLTSGNFLGMKGNTKVLMTNFAERNLENRKVTPQKIDVGEQTEFVFIGQDKQGIYKYAEQKSGDFKPKIKNSLSYLVKAPINVRTTWVEHYTTEMLMEQNYSLSLTATIESLDEVVTVPAGTFERCLKVAKTGRTQKDKGIWGKEEVSVEQYTWYAPDVGLVQSVIKEKGTTIMVGAAQEMMQLESFKK